MTEFSMGLTGDINDIVNAHNLAMVALTARMQHERNYDDGELQGLPICGDWMLTPPGSKWAGLSTFVPKAYEILSLESVVGKMVLRCSQSLALR